MVRSKYFTWFMAAILALAYPSLQAMAQETYPSSAIRIVWSFPSGSRGDVIARQLAQKLTEQMKVNVFVDSKPGASGDIGAEFVVKSRPDGYTLLFNTSSVILNKAIGQKAPYDVFKDLTPVSLVATGPFVLVENPSVPASTVPQFISYLKANPDKLAYGSGGTGAITHLAALLFLQSNGVSALHVPYKGMSPASVDLAAGRIQFCVMDLAVALPLIKDKRITALGVTSQKRMQLLPNVPTISETMPGFEIGNWFSIMAPAHTPGPIVQRLNREIKSALAQPDMASQLQENDVAPFTSTPEEFASYLQHELERWTGVIKSAGVKVE